MKRFFFRRNWRERVLLLVTLAVGVGLWLTSLQGRFRRANGRWTAAKEYLKEQATWLGNAAEIEAQMKARLDRAKEGRSLNANQLVGQLNTLLKKQQFTARQEAPVTERRPPVALHTLSLTIEKVELRALAEFVDHLAVELPLVNIEQLTITSEPRTSEPRKSEPLAVRLKLYGLELLP